MDNIQLRSKIQKLCRSEDEKLKIVEIVMKLLIFPIEVATDFIFQLQCGSATPRFYGQEKLFQEVKGLSDDVRKKIASELQYQYKIGYPNAKNILTLMFCNENIQIAYDALVNATGQNELVCYIVLHHIINMKDKQRVIFLLNSDKDAYRYGGVRALGFNDKEALYLKKYATEIKNLVNSMAPF